MTDYAERSMFGGSNVQDVTSPGLTLSLYARRLQVLDPQAAGYTITLPDATTVPATRTGAPIFYILNVSTSYSFTVSSPDGFSFLLDTEEALSLCVTPEGWIYRHSSVGGGTIVPPQEYWNNATLDATLSTLIAVWKMNDSSAPLITETLDTLDLQVSGAGTPAPSYQLTGIDGYAAEANMQCFQNNGTLPIGTSEDFSVAFWRRFTCSAPVYFCPILWFDSTNYVYRHFDGNTMQGLWGYGIGGTFGNVNDSTVYTSTGWHLGLMIKSGNVYTSYEDNILVGSKTQAGWNPGSSPKLQINAFGTPPSAQSPGPNGSDIHMDEITVWKHALSANERTALWNAGAGRFYVQP